MNIEQQYIKYYKNIDFERIELFRLIKRIQNSKQVIYTGSSIHITPSFIFNNVLYIDKSDLARSFFSQTKEVLGIVNKYKEYKGKAQVSFLDVDYKTVKISQKTDLLISIFADSVMPALLDNVIKTGMIIINNFRNEIDSIEQRKDAVRIGYILKRKKYKMIDNGLNDAKAKKKGADYVKKSDGFSYADKEVYHVFRKTK